MPTLEEQVSWWLKQSAHDLEMAKSNRQNGFHDGCALMCQQSVEKHLKALWLRTRATTPPKVHQCDKLAQMLSAPPPVRAAADVVEGGYLVSRYPDAAQGVPFERFNDAESEKRLHAAEEVQQWVLQQLATNP